MDINDNDDDEIRVNEGSSYYNMTSFAPVEIIEIDSTCVSESELSEFVSADTIIINNNSNDITIHEISDEESNPPKTFEEEEELIKKFIDGELTFSEYNAQLGKIDEDIIEEIEDDTIDEIQVNEIEKKDIPKVNTNLNDIRPIRFKRKKSILPPALQGLMGEANLCFARGDNKLAEKVCLEIIRQVPLAPEPFLTLAQIYETSDPEKFMQFSLISAHLNPSDIGLWIRLSELSLEQGNTKQAITCLAHAINADQKNTSLRMRRIKLLESIGEEKLALRCYYNMIKYIPKDESEFLMKTAREVAEKLHKDNNIEKALDAMKCAYAKVPELFKLEDINILLDLCVSNRNYISVLQYLNNFIGLNYEMSEEKENTIISCEIPDDIILDFRSKLIVSMIHLNYSNLDSLVENALAFISIEEAGDCHLDIAEALMQEKFYDKALNLLIPLVGSENFSLAAVWLRHADCYRALNNYDEAIKSYKKVVQLAPQVLDARVTLATLLKQKGLDDEALKILKQDPECELLDVKLLYERCFILKETKHYEEYLNDGFLIISKDSIKIRNIEELNLICTHLKYQSRIVAIRDLRILRGESIDDLDGPEYSLTPIAELTINEEWELYQDLITVAVDIKNYSMAQKIAFHALLSKRLQRYSREIEFYALLTSIFNLDAYSSYRLIKDFIIKDYKNVKIWNLLNLIVQFSEDIRYSRFLMRFLNRIEPNPMVYILQANNCLVSGTYKYALNDYLSIYKKTNDPLLALLCGVTFLSMSIQKYMSKKPNLIKQSIAFFSKYSDLRSSTAYQEVNYNFGRLYHQIGLISLAVYYYKLVLDYDDEMIRTYPEHLNLKREAAFNLHLIYKASGNLALARKVLYDYVTI